MEFYISHRMFLITSGFLNKTSKLPFSVLNKAPFKIHRTSYLCCLSSDAKTQTPLKKDVSGPYPTAYDPKEVEKEWYDWWERKGLFFSESDANPRSKDKTSEYCLVLPPPNVTGNLHIGHTLTVTIQDCILRWRRMKGERVVWIPGYDHGGIATQTVVEKKLHKEKKLTRHDLGREEFVREIDQWKTVTQANIEKQLKMLGASLDFRKSSFTMDANASKAVNKVFIQLFEENLIYRKEKLVNWSGEIRSVISDIEVDHLDIPGKSKVRVPGLKDPVELGLMDYFYYPVVDSDEKLLIATTRLETMLGDSAVAVNPTDARYSHLIGKRVTHPYSGENLPIIADESISKDFGTGVMKVTPAHDVKDFEVGLKHRLEMKDVFADDGTVTADFENFKGKHRLVVRQLLRKSLSSKDLFKEALSHSHSIPFCSRTGDIVEPRLKDQWYLDCRQMGKRAVQVVNEKQLRFIPDYHEKVWYEWFKHLKDWCISRQLWWGHRIPAYRVTLKEGSQERWVAASCEAEAVEKASKTFQLSPEEFTLTQDCDVLDTWFSSALYPLTSLGWPSQEENLQKRYPLSLMETGFDILFFWVARMVMLGGHITGKLPFQEVLLHGMVCDSHGRKMTKSLGNAIDPLDVIRGIPLEGLLERVEELRCSLSPEESKTLSSAYKHNFPSGIPECGTDGLRFALLSHDVQTPKINVDVKSIRVCRHFCNKIWQGVRLFTKVIESCPREKLVPLSSAEVLSMDKSGIDCWVLSRLARVVAVSNANFETYNFHTVTTAARQFWVQNFCDVYIEYAKCVVMESEEQRLFASRVLLTCIETFLRVVSPMMPFLAEELYQRLSLITNIEAYDSISVAPFPAPEQYSRWRNTVLEADVLTVTDIIAVARSLKSKQGATRSRPSVVIAVEEENTLSSLSPFCHLIVLLARLDSVTFHLTQGQEFFEQYPQDSWVFETYGHGITVVMDVEEKAKSPEMDRSKLDRMRSELNKLNKMLSDSGYRKNAPLSVQEKTMAKKASLEGELQKLLNFCGKKEDRKTDSSGS